MRIPCSFALVAILAAHPTLAAPGQSDAQAILIQKDLSPGVRLHSVDGERKRSSKPIPLVSGVHLLKFTYAYDAQRDQSGPWVNWFTFECSIDAAGTYTLRSKDSKFPDMTPTIWIESANQVAPKCIRIDA